MILIHASFIQKKKTKYLNSDLKKGIMMFSKYNVKRPWKKWAVVLVFEMSFFQKSDVIWSAGHYPCLVLGLVYQNQEKYFWALLIPKHKSSIKLGNIRL